jgi:hypothetical protein
MNSNAPWRRRPLALALVVAVTAVGLASTPFVAASASASDSSTASSILSRANGFRTSAVEDEAPFTTNRFLATRAGQWAKLYAACGTKCTTPSKTPSEEIPALPEPNTSDVLDVVHVAKGSKEDTRLFAALFAKSSTTVLEDNTGKVEVGSVGVYTKGSNVWAVLEVTEYNGGDAPWDQIVGSVPTVSGKAATAAELKSKAKATVPTTGVTINYIWKTTTSTTSLGSGSELQVPTGLVGQKLELEVVYTKPGYVPLALTSKPTKRVVDGTFSAEKPGFTPDSHFNVYTTATTGLGDVFPAPTTVSYQWYRNGKAVPGATSDEYGWSPINKGATFYAAIKLSGPDMKSLTVTTAHHTIVGMYIATVQQPVVILPGGASGEYVGGTLSTEPGTWGPGTVKIHIQWNVNGKPVKGANDILFAVTHSMLGKYITVTYTGTESGYASRSLTSVKTATVTTAPAP